MSSINQSDGSPLSFLFLSPKAALSATIQLRNYFPAVTISCSHRPTSSCPLFSTSTAGSPVYFVLTSAVLGKIPCSKPLNGIHNHIPFSSRDKSVLLLFFLLLLPPFFLMCSIFCHLRNAALKSICSPSREDMTPFSNSLPYP